jgi:hypothetical protein
MSFVYLGNREGALEATKLPCNSLKSGLHKSDNCLPFGGGFLAHSVRPEKNRAAGEAAPCLSGRLYNSVVGPLSRIERAFACRRCAGEDTRRMRRRSGDRRVRMRFEVVGELVGTLEARSALYIRDISLGGALVESGVLLDVGSVHRVTGMGDEGTFQLSMRVARIDVLGPTGPYLAGVEFVDPAPEVIAQIRGWMVEDGDAV